MEPTKRVSYGSKLGRDVLLTAPHPKVTVKKKKIGMAVNILQIQLMEKLKRLRKKSN